LTGGSYRVSYTHDALGLWFLVVKDMGCICQLQRKHTQAGSHQDRAYK
jgi:hypothetical protein